MVHIQRKLRKIAVLGGAVALLAIGSQAASADASPVRPAKTAAQVQASDLAALTAQIQQKGTAHVIVSLKAPAYETMMAPQATTSRSSGRAAVRAGNALALQARATLRQALVGYHATEYTGTQWTIPAMALSVDQTALNYLKTSPLVASLSIDHVLHAQDAGSDQQIGAQAMWGAVGGGTLTGYTGAGESVAVIDSGVQENHPFFTTDGSAGTARINPQFEACYSGGGDQTATLCPNGQVRQDLDDGSNDAAGAGVNCPLTLAADCAHGTHVAGIIAGNSMYQGGVGYAGVAPLVNIIPIQVFSKNATQTGVAAYDSDVISGLNEVSYLTINEDNLYIPAVIASVDLSDSPISGNCDNVNSAMVSIVQKLTLESIAVVIPTGNDSSPTGIAYPACVSNVISVGAVDSNDNVASFSNYGPTVTILAPGVGISSSIPYTGNGAQFGTLDGTSMAAAQVAGALALVRQEMNGSLSIISYNDVSVKNLSDMLVFSGRVLSDGQSRLQVDSAGIAALPLPKTVGIYLNNTFYVRNTNSTGNADTHFVFGNGSDAYPIVGDWTASKYDQPGIYYQNTGVFVVCEVPAGNQNSDCSTAPPSWLSTFVLGNPGDFPLSGRWYLHGPYYVDGATGHATLLGYTPTGAGVYRPTNGLLYMRNTLTTGYADNAEVLGIPGDFGIAGNWAHDGQGTPGVYRASSATFYLSNQVTNGIVYADINFSYGSGNIGDIPLIGNWAGGPNMIAYNSGVGLYRSGSSEFLLRDVLTTGGAEGGPTGDFAFGPAGSIPVMGDWHPSSTYFVPPHAPGAKIVPSLTPVHTPAPANAGSVQAGNGIGG